MTKPKEHPALFNGAMVRAIGTGQKTQTRRIVKPQPHLVPHHEPVRPEPRSNGRWVFMTHTDRPSYSWATGHVRNPYGVPGDRIWVRETWSTEHVSVYPCPLAWYRADFTRHDDPVLNREHNHKRGEGERPRADCFACLEEHKGTRFRWRPSIHMPRRLARYLLDVTAVRVERLQDISEEDARAEGIEEWAKSAGELAILSALGCAVPTAPRFLFQLLWISSYGQDSWDANPWVWVTTFKLVQ